MDKKIMPIGDFAKETASALKMSQIPMADQMKEALGDLPTSQEGGENQEIKTTIETLTPAQLQNEVAVPQQQTPAADQAMAAKLSTMYPEPIDPRPTWGGVPISQKEADGWKRSETGDLYGFAFCFGALGVIFMMIAVQAISYKVAFSGMEVDLGASATFGLIVAPAAALAAIGAAFAFIYKSSKTLRLAVSALALYALYAVGVPVIGRISASSAGGVINGDLGSSLGIGMSSSSVATMGTVLVNLVIVALLFAAVTKSEKLKRAIER